MVELFYSTGMRRAELVQLQLTDVALNQGVLKVLGKRNKERLIPLIPSVIQTIKKYLEENEIKIVSKRINQVPGTHSVNYDSAIDSITMKHTAHNREGFALGAVVAK